MNSFNSYSNNTAPLSDIKGFLLKKDMLSRLILINVIVFLIINIYALFLFLFGLDQDFILANGTNRITYYLSLPSSLSTLVWRPWSIITYMFVQEGILHLFFNMLVLYVGGNIFNRYIGQSKLLSVYVLSGIAGAFLYIFIFNIFPAFAQLVSVSYAIGASASVLGIFVAAAAFMPNLMMNLMFIGNIRLKYIALIFVGLDILNIRNGNAGGHIAHIGGALFGYLFIQQLRKNKDWSLWFNAYFNQISSWFTSFYKPKDPFTKVYRNPNESLSTQEKQILFDASNN